MPQPVIGVSPSQDCDSKAFKSKGLYSYLYRPPLPDNASWEQIVLYDSSQGLHNPDLLLIRYPHPERQPDQALRNRVRHGQLSACPAVAQACRG